MIGRRPIRTRLELTRVSGIGPDAALLGDLRGTRVAELGCGSGHNLAHLVANHAVIGIGIDHDRHAIARARHLYGHLVGIELCHTDAAAYLRGLPAGNLDLCLSIFGAFSFTADQNLLLAAVVHALRPGGRLLISTRVDDRLDRVILLSRR